ncbi:chromate efflux transporter [Cryobacterium sp. Hh11]|uniref:chromate efflux transporter n=1 Tax=Cryobacterium sp. Hh11 TaxID=2555868 RepID=UPI00106990D0|nr:chromate efflux transporter [Cryobacterium sp. Hh11]TFD50954.1 chromate efflux transporter [Cryobacterium sp. Hh11]
MTPKKARPASATDAAETRDLVPFGDAVRVWFLVSLETFGGPAGQIAVMHRILVEEKRWIGHRRFQHAMNFCVMLPGPEAQQLAIYIGWLLNGKRGGLVAGTLFVLPGVVALLALSAIFVAYGDAPVVAALFTGIAAATLIIVGQAIVKVGRRSLVHPALVVLAVAAFAALALFAVPFPVVILIAALTGWLLTRYVPGVAKKIDGSGDAPDGIQPVIADNALNAGKPSAVSAGKVLAVGLTLWILPIIAVVFFTGIGSVFTQQGVFFSTMALVTFGGAYAVLAYVAQQAVEVFHWLTPGEMARGLGLAETTPGPLIMVVQFVGFIGAYRNPGDLDPWVAAIIGALLTTWVTFVPCFIFIFLGAPHIERLRGNRHLSGALTGITAAVVGVIANLAVFFAINILFSETFRLDSGLLQLQLPVLSSLSILPVAVAAVAAVLMLKLRWTALRTIGVCALLGLAAGLLELATA